MQITLPENIGDINLRIYKRYEVLNVKLEEEEIDLEEYNKRKINLFSGIPYRKIENVAHKDLKEVMVLIDQALDVDAPFRNKFKMNGIEFGFIPNFDNISTAEYADISKYGAEVETLHNLMAILYRPIAKSSLGTYDITTYEGTAEHAESMLDMPMNLVNGALSFFFHLSSELESCILRSTREESAKRERQNTLVSGDGLQPSTN